MKMLIDGKSPWWVQQNPPANVEDTGSLSGQGRFPHAAGQVNP